MNIENLHAFLKEEPFYIRCIPKKKDLRLAVLSIISERFTQDELSEQQVNQILKPICDDFVEIRRYLVDYGFLIRSKDGSCYRRAHHTAHEKQ